MSKSFPTAFVLGGGGLLGAAEVGMLRGLLERDVSPDLIIGSSVGALNGSFLATQPTIETVEQLVEVWNGLSDRAVFGSSMIGQLGRLARSGTSLHASDGLRALLNEHIGGAHFSDLPVRFECVAACIERAAPRWFSSGSVTDAVLASCAVPGLFPPIEINGEHFYDGGLVSSVPIGRALELGAHRIFVLQVGRLEQALRPPRRPWEVAVVTFEIARRHDFEQNLTRLPPGVEVHILPAGSRPPAVSIRYRRASGVQARIETAHAATSAYLDQALSG